MNENETNARMEYLDQEIKKIEKQIQLLPELELRLVELKVEKRELEKDADLEVI